MTSSFERLSVRLPCPLTGRLCTTVVRHRRSCCDRCGTHAVSRWLTTSQPQFDRLRADYEASRIAVCLKTGNAGKQAMPESRQCLKSGNAGNQAMSGTRQLAGKVNTAELRRAETPRSRHRRDRIGCESSPAARRRRRAAGHASELARDVPLSPCERTMCDCLESRQISAIPARSVVAGPTCGPAASDMTCGPSAPSEPRPYVAGGNPQLSSARPLSGLRRCRMLPSSPICLQTAARLLRVFVPGLGRIDECSTTASMSTS
jgi:hypothetical protein